MLGVSDQNVQILMELDEKYVDVIVKRYLRHKKSTEDCFLIRNGKKVPLDTIEEFENNSL
jgi:hypothetical protein